MATAFGKLLILEETARGTGRNQSLDGALDVEGAPEPRVDIDDNRDFYGGTNPRGTVEDLRLR